MKTYIDIETLDILTIRESMRYRPLTLYGWNCKVSNRWRTCGKFPYWKISSRVAKKYINKYFDDAFSEYCSKVPFQYQYGFFDEFENFFIPSNLYPEKFIIDKDGLIQINPRYENYKTIWSRNPSKTEKSNSKYWKIYYEKKDAIRKEFRNKIPKIYEINKPTNGNISGYNISTDREEDKGF